MKSILKASTIGLAMLIAIISEVRSVQADTPARILFDFTTNRSGLGWTNVNDGVMGGLSQGRYRIRDNKLHFFGKLSLANNGGFASVRSKISRLNLHDSDALLIRVRGDGRKYYLNLRTPSNRTAFSYRVSFATKAGKWQEVRLPMKMFRATSFGRVLRNARPVNAQSVHSIGFMIADKKVGPFELEVDWIKVVPSGNAAS